MYSVVAHQNFRKQERSPRSQGETLLTDASSEPSNKLSFYQRFYKYVKKQFNKQKGKFYKFSLYKEGGATA